MVDRLCDMASIAFRIARSDHGVDDRFFCRFDDADENGIERIVVEEVNAVDAVRLLVRSLIYQAILPL